MPSLPALASRTTSRRRRPQTTALYQVVAGRLEAFLAQQRAADRYLPRYVERELRAYLECGILYVQSEIMRS